MTFLVHLILVSCLSVCLHDIATATTYQFIPGTLSSFPSAVGEPRSLEASLNPTDPPGSFLLADGSALTVWDTSSNPLLLAGDPTNPGYVDGPSAESRFNHVGDFTQNRDGSQIYIADELNHCLRILDRESGNVTTYAGACTESGRDAGRRLIARFSYPSGVALAPTNKTLYIADRENNRIVGVDLDEADAYVWVVLDGSPNIANIPLNLPTAVSFNNKGDRLIMTTDDGVLYITDYQFTNATSHLITSHVVGGRSLSTLRNDQYLAVTDGKGKRVLFVDLINGGVGQFCSDRSRNSSRAGLSSSTCELQIPQGLAVLSDTELIVTERNGSAIRLLTFNLEALTTTTTTTTTVATTTVTTDESSGSSTTAATTTVLSRIFDTTNVYFDRTTRRRSKSDDEKSNTLAIGLSVGIIIPLALLGALAGFLGYAIKSRQKALRKAMYNRRNEQGGYSGPGSHDNTFHSALDQAGTRNGHYAPQTQNVRPPSYYGPSY